MIDPDIFIWLGRSEPPTEIETQRAATIIADRLCGAVSNPIIRNAQERRQLSAMKSWLEERGYQQLSNTSALSISELPPGTFCFHKNIPVRLEGGNRTINIPIDDVIMPLKAAKGDYPLLFEAKSAGDFTNTNKRRKEEAMKVKQLIATYGEKIQFNLFLCGYFDSVYLGYEASEGIDWVWEHRIDDLAQFGI
jgi:type II restriction enzyme